MRLVVIGGTGRTGARVAAEAVARGHEVVVVGRSAAPEGPVEAVRGDATDPGVVARAIAGADAVVVSLSIPRASGSPFAQVVGPPDLHSRSAAVLLRAMAEAGVRRLLKISAQGVGPSAPRAGWGFRALVAVSNLAPAFADHAVADALVAEAPLDWTVAHPPMLSDGPGGPVRAGEDVTTGTFTRLSRDALACWVLDALPDPAWHRRRISLAPA